MKQEVLYGMKRWVYTFYTFHSEIFLIVCLPIFWLPPSGNGISLKTKNAYESIISNTLIKWMIFYWDTPHIQFVQIQLAVSTLCHMRPKSIWVQLKTSLELGSEQNKFKFSAWQKLLTNFPIDLCEDMFINGNTTDQGHVANAHHKW